MAVGAGFIGKLISGEVIVNVAAVDFDFSSSLQMDGNPMTAMFGVLFAVVVEFLDSCSKHDLVRFRGGVLYAVLVGRFEASRRDTGTAVLASSHQDWEGIGHFGNSTFNRAGGRGG